MSANKTNRPSLRTPLIHPFAGMNIPTLVDQQARLRADHTFLAWEPFAGESRTWTYAEFARDTKALASGLRARGVKKGEVVLIHLDNCPEFLLSWVACARLGAIAVTTNTRSVSDELNYFAENSNAGAAITQPKYAQLVSQSCPDLNWVAVTETENDGTLSENPLPDQLVKFDGLFGDAETFDDEEVDAFDSLSVMYTSGTTSRPKGVLWTHANGLWAGRGSAFHEALTPNDVHHVVLPLFHMNAMSCSILATLWVGATAVLQPRFSASRFWDVALKHKCTWASLVPFCVNAIQGQPVPDHHFKYWGFGVSFPQIDKHFRVKSMGWWGMTETVTVGIVTSPYHDNTALALGRPSPLYEISIIDDAGNPVGPGQTGDLRIKGVPGLSLFAEYLNNEEATQSSFDESGGFITGDRCTLLADGSIVFADRSKDMLKVGGENVAASEIERVVSSVPGVAEVAVVAAPDRMLNEVPVAFVIAAMGSDANALSDKIASTCESKLADFKRPREIRIVDQLPRATLEKVAKAELRNLLIAEAEAS